MFFSLFAPSLPHIFLSLFIIAFFVHVFPILKKYSRHLALFSFRYVIFFSSIKFACGESVNLSSVYPRSVTLIAFLSLRFTLYLTFSGVVFITLYLSSRSLSFRPVFLFAVLFHSFLSISLSDFL